MNDPVSDAWFPEGATPVALHVVTDRVEWWTSPGSVTQLFDVAASKLSGETPSAGESGTIETPGSPV